jgi:hypothetical protein
MSRLTCLTCLRGSHPSRPPSLLLRYNDTESVYYNTACLNSEIFGGDVSNGLFGEGSRTDGGLPMTMTRWVGAH